MNYQRFPTIKYVNRISSFIFQAKSDVHRNYIIQLTQSSHIWVPWAFMQIVWILCWQHTDIWNSYRPIAATTVLISIFKAWFATTSSWLRVYGLNLNVNRLHISGWSKWLFLILFAKIANNSNNKQLNSSIGIEHKCECELN